MFYIITSGGSMPVGSLIGYNILIIPPYYYAANQMFLYGHSVPLVQALTAFITSRMTSSRLM